MTTRDDVIDAINRIERAGHAGDATRAAQLEVLMLPPSEYDRILNRLRTAFPELVAPTPPPAPPSEQQGIAARAMKQAEAVLSQQQSATAEFDRQVIEALLHAHQTTEQGKRLLDELQAQIENAARTWDLSTPAGAREFQRFLVGKLRQIVAVVQETNDDDTSKQALAAAWAALYASQDGDDKAAGGAPRAAVAPHLPEAEDPEADLNPEPLPADDPEPAAQNPAPRSAPAPDFGGGTPSAGLSPAGGVPGGLSPPGLLQGLQQRPQPGPYDDEPLPSDELASAHEPSLGDAGEKEADATAASAPEPDSATTTVKLPDGDTVTAPTPQLAAVVRAAAGGMPISDAFGQQGITIPSPGTAVTSPVDQSRVGPGDVGMFTDRHALAVGNSKALLDGQIQHIASVRGPSFLGWQHPPTPGETTTGAQAPAPTRLSATVRT